MEEIDHDVNRYTQLLRYYLQLLYGPAVTESGVQILKAGLWCKAVAYLFLSLL